MVVVLLLVVVLVTLSMVQLVPVLHRQWVFPGSLLPVQRCIIRWLLQMVQGYHRQAGAAPRASVAACCPCCPCCCCFCTSFVVRQENTRVAGCVSCQFLQGGCVYRRLSIDPSVVCVHLGVGSTSAVAVSSKKLGCKGLVALVTPRAGSTRALGRQAMPRCFVCCTCVS